MRSSPSIIALSSCMLLLQHAEASSAVRTSSISTSSSTTQQQTSYRFLEDQQRNFYGDYHMVYDKCFRVKVPNNNDDDGNAYFYNGAYRSQSMAYASFFLCPESAGCYDCDTSTAYVMDLQEYLESYVEHLQGYCYACQQKCRRRLDEAQQQQGDDGAGYNGMIDCYECADQCQFVNGNDDGNGGNDESQFLECQQAYEDEDGIQYYSAPTCGSSGNIEMGLFYDNECTIKKSDDESGFKNNFGYKTFQSIENWCTYCDYNGDDNGVCDNDGAFMEDTFQCVDGQNVNYNVQDDEMNVCKTYKKVSKEWQYASAKKPSPWPYIISLLVLIFAFLFLSYTYYVRHTQPPSSPSENVDKLNMDAAAAAPASSGEGATDPTEPKAAYAQLT